jgi:hypothetical protein
VLTLTWASAVPGRQDLAPHRKAIDIWRAGGWVASETYVAEPATYIRGATNIRCCGHEPKVINK